LPVIQATDGGPLESRPNVAGNYGYLGASLDFSHLVVVATVPLVSADTAPVGLSRVYEVTGATGPSPTLRLVSVDNSGSPLLGCPSSPIDTGAGLGNGYGSAPSPTGTGAVHAISADGSTIFISTNDAAHGCALQLYARVNGSSTVAISAPAVNNNCTTSACTSAPEGSALFQGASADGSKAFFLSTQQLTDNASQDPNDDAWYPGCLHATSPNGCNLYLYDSGRPVGHNLVDVSAGDTSGLGPRVQGVMAVSDDGSRAYFVAQGLLTTQPNALGQTAQAGANNLYVYDAGSGTVRFIGLQCGNGQGGIGVSGTLSGVAQCPGPEDDGDFTYANGGGRFRAATTPDGRYLVFTTAAQLTPDDTNTTADVYEYDAQTGSLVRVSVGHDGQDNNGNENLDKLLPAASGYSGPSLESRQQGNPVSSDGQTVIFTTAAPLQRSAVNGRVDLYEWHQGEVTLISGGQSSQDLSPDAVTMSPSGRDIVFLSDQGLVPQDTDGLLDAYDARIGGGFPAPPVPAAACAGDACQGQPPGGPALPTAASVSFSGPGNAAAGSGPQAGRARVLTRTVRGASFLVAVSVPGAGRITITGAAVRRASEAVGTAGAYRLRVTLTARERSALRHRRKLRLAVRVAYAPAAGPARSLSFPLTVKA
jgi:hypothetical protein